MRLLPILLFAVLVVFSPYNAWANELALNELPPRVQLPLSVSLNPVGGEFHEIQTEPAAPTARIEINIPARRMKLYDNNQLVFEFPVAVGATGFKTPIGKRELTQIVWNPWWMPPKSDWAKDEKPVPPGLKNPLGPVKMNLGSAILLHGTNKPQSVGRAASHGCMRMNNDDARQLAWWIQSHYTDKSNPALFDDYDKKRGRSFYVAVPTPLPVEIKYEVFEKNNDQIVIHPDVYGRIANKKVKIKEWLVSQGVELASINETLLFEKMAQIKRESLPLYLSELSPSFIPVSAPEEMAAAVQNNPHP